VTLDKDGIPFIDRDGTHFRVILNYLRSGKFVPGDIPSLHEIQIEADYYQIKELSQEIERILQRDKKVQYCKVNITEISTCNTATNSITGFVYWRLDWTVELSCRQRMGN
jgi:hypothetical protein